MNAHKTYGVWMCVFKFHGIIMNLFFLCLICVVAEAKEYRAHINKKEDFSIYIASLFYIETGAFDVGIEFPWIRKRKIHFKLYANLSPNKSTRTNLMVAK